MAHAYSHLEASLRRGLRATCLAALMFTVVTTESSAQTTVTVDYRWIDRAGANAHPLRNVNIEFFEDDGIFGTEAMGTFTTDSNGIVTAASNVTDLLDDTLEVFNLARLEITNVASVRSSHAAADPLKLRVPTGNGFFLATEGAGAPPNAFGPVSFANTNNTIRGLSVLQLVDHMHDYFSGAPFNATLPPITIVFQNNTDAASMGGNRMNLGDRAWHDSDVVFHEYGHHVQEHNNLTGPSLGLAHAFGQDNIGALNGGNNYGSLNGSRLAWQEAGATFLGMLAVHDGNLNGGIPNLPAADRDLNYHDFTRNDNGAFVNNTDLRFSVNVETRSVTVNNGMTVRQGGMNSTVNFTGAGEGDELSVVRAMWDFHDNTAENYANQRDFTAFSAKEMFDLMVGNETFRDHWLDVGAAARANEAHVGLAAGAPDAEVMARLGATLEEYNIASTPLSSGIFKTRMPLFRWMEQNNDNSIFHRLLIYSDDWTQLIFDSMRLAAATVGDVAGALDLLSFTLPMADRLDLGRYNYVVLNDPVLTSVADLDAGRFNWYWSGSRSFTVVPEPSSVVLVTLGLGGVLWAARRRSLRPAA